MRRGILFTVRINNDERQAIAALAKRLSRSQSDAVRFVVIEAAKQLIQATEDPKQCKSSQRGGSDAIAA